MRRARRLDEEDTMKMTTVFVLAALMPATAQAAASDGNLAGYNALKLTPSQQRGVYRGVGTVPEVTPPQHYLIHVGGSVPSSMQLKALPTAAANQAPQLNNDDYIKLDQGQLLLVKPQDRIIVEIIDSYHGTEPGQPTSAPGPRPAGALRSGLGPLVEVARDGLPEVHLRSGRSLAAVSLD
jgi:hypothetical protein